MKKHYLTAIFLLIASSVFSQTDTTKAKSQIDTAISLNLLRAPASPASNLLGISPNEIQRPTDVKAFMLSVQNASQGFSTVPSSFGVDIAPYWFARKKYKFTNQMSKPKKFLQSVAQTFVVSAAVRNYQSKAKLDSTTQLGIGLRVSLVRGKYDREDVRNIFKAFESFKNVFESKRAIDTIFNRALKERNSLAIIVANRERNGDTTTTEFKNLKKQVNIKEQVLADRSQKIKDTIIKEKGDSVKEFVNAKPIRTGFKLDLAGGLAWDFADTKFGNGKVFKAGTWITSGWECKSGFAFLTILRYLYNPDKVFADDKGILKSNSVHTYDGGIRLNFQAKDNPFSGSLEGIFRGVAAKEINNTWRAVLNANYEVSKNTILTLSLGRDFDKTFKKDGNVIAFLNFVKGFGF